MFIYLVGYKASARNLGIFSLIRLSFKSNCKIFSGFKYAAVQSGIERAITYENNWEDVANVQVDLGAFVNFEKIGEFLFGGFTWQCFHTFLTFLSYIGGLGMLHAFLKYLLKNLNFTLPVPVQIKLKPHRVSQRRFQKEKRIHFDWSDFGDEVETNGSSHSRRRFHQKRRNHFNGFDFQDDVESNCSFNSDASDVEKTNYDFDFDDTAPPPYSSDPTAPDLDVC